MSILPIVPQIGSIFLPLESLDVVGLAVERDGLQKVEACLKEGNCLISTSLSIIPLPDEYDCV